MQRGAQPLIRFGDAVGGGEEGKEGDGAASGDEVGVGEQKLERDADGRAEVHGIAPP